MALILKTLKVSANVTNYFNKLPLCMKSTLVFFNNDFALKHILKKMVRESHMIGNQVWDLGGFLVY